MNDDNGFEFSLSDGCYHGTVRHFDDAGEPCQNECHQDLRHITERRPHKCVCGKVWDDSQTLNGHIKER